MEDVFVEGTRVCAMCNDFFFCLFLCVPQKLNEHAAALFETGEETEVNTGLSIMNELVVACIPLLLVDEMEEKDMVAVEDMRNRWCSYLGQEMERKSSGWNRLEFLGGHNQIDSQFLIKFQLSIVTI